MHSKMKAELSNPIIYHRRKCKSLNSPPLEMEDGDDDDKRKQKRVKVMKPQADENSNFYQKHNRIHQHSSIVDLALESGFSSSIKSEDQEKHARKCSINAINHRSGDVFVQETKVVKVMDNPHHGSSMKFGTTTPLPDKKLLISILERLQKKDIYGAFSEPVDINELPDYFEVIKKPMDFGTVRKKLDVGAYKSLEELEADVYLICSNAMFYNASDTVYYQQACCILKLSKRYFKKFKDEGNSGHQRGKPTSNECPAAFIQGVDTRYADKQFMVDDNRRNTYQQSQCFSSTNNSPFSTNSIEEMKQLVPVGLHEPLSYVKSLARYASTLGPVAWKVANKKIDYILSLGAPPQQHYFPSEINMSSTSIADSSLANWSN